MAYWIKATRSVLAAFAVTALSTALVARAEDAKEDADAGEKEEQVQLADLPAKVQAALKKAAGDNGQVKEIEKETQDGKTVYEVEVALDGKLWELTFDEAGTLLGKEEEGAEDDDDADDDDDDNEEEDDDAAKK